MQEVIETEHVNILTPDEKMGEQSDSNDEETRGKMPANKKGNKKKDS